jgi:hypothetical protein
VNKSDPNKAPPAPDVQRSAQPYAAGDPIPVPEATELDTDSAWGMFEDLADANVKPKLNATLFEKTVPADLTPMDPKTALPKPPPS